MARITVDFQFTHITDPTTGRNLGLGKAYFGVIDGNPFTNPADRVNVYAVQPDGSELLISQPIEVSAAGIAVVGGTPVQLRVDGEYSLDVRSYSGAQSYYAARVATWEADTDTRIDALETYSSADRIYETVAAMKAATNPAGSLVRCKQYGPTTPVLSTLIYLSRGTGWPTAADGYINHLDAGGNFLELLADEIGPEMAGAIGDGVVNDLVACRKASDFCAANKKSFVFRSGFTFGINGYITVKNGVPKVHGLGGVISYLAGPFYSGVLLQGQHGGQASNVKRCDVSGLIIRCNNQKGTGIFAENVSECSFTNNQIYNVIDGYGILIRAFADGMEDSARNVISGNIITLDQSGSDLVYGIELSSDFDYSPYTNPVDYWKANFIDKPAVHVNSYSTINGNVILGGYYGISLSAARYCNIFGNVTSVNIRGVSMQHYAISNIFNNNLVTECLSSGFTVGYSSSYNKVNNNVVYSSRATIQALLNCYVGVSNNSFDGNDLTCVAGAGPNWYMYCGINAVDNSFTNNRVTGPCQKSYASVESNWNNAVTNPAHYAFGEPVVVNNFANTPTARTTFSGNVFYPASAVPVFFVSQISDARGNWSQFSPIITDNTVYGNSPNYQLEIYEMVTGGVSAGVLSANTFDPGAAQGKYLLPNGRASFSMIRGNSYINDGTFTLPANIATPNVSVGYIFQHSDTMATSVTNYTGVGDGTEIIIQLTVNTTIVNNASFIRLKGGVNIVGSTAGGFNALFCLRRISGVWFEQWRNF